jgi:hypothetical protein
MGAGAICAGARLRTGSGGLYSPPSIEAAIPAAAEYGPLVGWFPLAPGEVYWPPYTRNPTYIREVNISNVSVTKITRVTNAIAKQPASSGPPPQIAHQQFADRLAATVAPARVFTTAAKVAPAAVPAPMLKKAAVNRRPPPVVASPPAPPAERPVATGPKAPAGHPATPATAHLPIGPNIAHLEKAPRVGPPEATTARQLPAVAGPTHPAGHPAPTEAGSAPRAGSPGAPAAVGNVPTPTTQPSVGRTANAVPPGRPPETRS